MAQIGYNYYKLDFGISGAYNKSYTDFINPRPGYAAGGTITFNQTPFINYIAEAQVGYIAGDKIPAAPNADISFKNKYALGLLRLQIQLGEFIDYSRNPFTNSLKNIYISSGIGALYSRLNISQPGFVAQQSTVRDWFIPFKAGYELKIFNDYNEPRIKVDIGYQYNYILGDDIDHYSNMHNDGFSQIVLGIKMGIGPYTSYGKPINY